MRHMRAFTLIELVTIFAIFGTLASITVPSYELLATRARITRAIAALDGLRSAETDYYRRTGKLPSSLDQLRHGNTDSAHPTPNFVTRIRLDHGGKLVAVLDASKMALISANRNEIALMPKLSTVNMSWVCGPNSANPVSSLFLPNSCLNRITAP